MNQIPAYKFSLKAVIFLLFIGQLWANVASHCYWMVDAESELIELYSSEGSEGDNKKSENDEIRIDLYITSIVCLEKTVDILYSGGLIPLHHPEITTPPPEPFFFLS